MPNICIIPARGGSNRIPGKNIRQFLGKPIIDYSIEAAHATGLFDRVIVSTDDSRIGARAAKLGCIFYKRRAELCQDHVPMVDAVLDVLRSQGSDGLQYDYVCMLYACAPFISASILVDGFKKLKEGGFDVVFPIYHGPSVERALFSRGDRTISRFPQYDEENSNTWLPSYYHAGQFFWARRTTLLVHHTFMQDNKAGILIPQAEAVDIDTPEDWIAAEIKYRLMREKSALI